MAKNWIRHAKEALGELEVEFDTNWRGRDARIELDALASALVNLFKDKFNDDAPSLNDVLSQLADDELDVSASAEAADKLLEYCAEMEYGLDYSHLLEEDEDESTDEARRRLLREMNQLRGTIHSEVSRLVDGIK